MVAQWLALTPEEQAAMREAKWTAKMEKKEAYMEEWEAAAGKKEGKMDGEKDGEWEDKDDEEFDDGEVKDEDLWLMIKHHLYRF